MSGFGLKASTQRKDTKANRQAHGCRLCTPSVFKGETIPTTGQDAHSLIEPDRCGLIDARHAPIATKFQSTRNDAMCQDRDFVAGWPYQRSSPSNALAFRRSLVSKPSVNQS
jgi:hypothetical protein